MCGAAQTAFQWLPSAEEHEGPLHHVLQQLRQDKDARKLQLKLGMSKQQMDVNICGLRMNGYMRVGAAATAATPAAPWCTEHENLTI
jgi:hypothetical protein